MHFQHVRKLSLYTCTTKSKQTSIYFMASLVEFFVILWGNWKSSLKDDPNATMLKQAFSGRFSSASSKTWCKNDRIFKIFLHRHEQIKMAPLPPQKKSLKKLKYYLLGNLGARIDFVHFCWLTKGIYLIQ